MIRLTNEQWERIRNHFREERILDGRPGRKPIPTRRASTRLSLGRSSKRTTAWWNSTGRNAGVLRPPGSGPFRIAVIAGEASPEWCPHMTSSSRPDREDGGGRLLADRIYLLDPAVKICTAIITV
jgi:hypothetical protein